MARVLITNDDGIDSPGIHHLAQVARAAGHDVVVAAPARDASGTSASVAFPERDGQLAITERQLPGLSGVPAFAVDAPPALITIIGIRGGFGPPPELVLSGINRGGNTGHAILHSGTVGAALTAAGHGIPAIALSLQLGAFPGGQFYWEAASRYLPELTPVMTTVDTAFVLNVNAPNLPARDIRGLREAKLAAFGTVQTNVEVVGDGIVQLVLSDAAADQEPGTDVSYLLQGYVTVSAVTPILEIPDVRLHASVESANRS